ncbi:maleate cis-trans isomerase family protein [Halorarius litoreus]|uniref:maleate cis-trans isomerase family protein n=1 Tax=Halorarius litoreus TaxID=2962676 RepID=UPI0020CC079D|nr:maleate cis-trans isomerase [Halorarius litoreus]
MYGWRGRIGLIVPSTNTVNEPDFYRHLPAGVSLHVSRMYLDQEAHRERDDLRELEKMTADADRCAASLATADVDVIAYGCTSGSFMDGAGHDAEIEAELEAVAGVPTVTTAAAVRRAMTALELETVAIATPYVDELNSRAERFFEGCGFEVTATSGLGIDIAGSDLDRRSHGAQLPERAYRQLAAMDLSDADGVFLSCTNYHVTDAIEYIEADLGTPVVTSNQATLWNALRVLNVDYADVDLGALFQR